MFYGSTFKVREDSWVNKARVEPTLDQFRKRLKKPTTFIVLAAIL
jgi:hypothetical protein